MWTSGEEEKIGKGGEKEKRKTMSRELPRIYVQSEKLEIEIHYRRVRGVNENTADLCRGAKE